MDKIIRHDGDQGRELFWILIHKHVSRPREEGD
jgi:hypothetical protein